MDDVSYTSQDNWFSDSDWAAYESYVAGVLERGCPGSTVTKNVRLKGLRSKRIRQVDVLVEAKIGGFFVRMVVDCKQYKRRVDVKHVEGFLSMLDDIRASKGILITTKGYTKGAAERAANDSRDIDLVIMPPERLSEFQWIGFAVPFKGPVAALVRPPKGWVIDNENTQDGPWQFCMYPLGHTLDSALSHRAFLYGVIVLKDDRLNTLENIATLHEERVLSRFPDAKFERLGCIERSDSLLRVGRVHRGYEGPEYTLYIDHSKGALTLVLLCPEGEDAVFLPVLKAVGRAVIMLDRIREPAPGDVCERIMVVFPNGDTVELPAG